MTHDGERAGHGTGAPGTRTGDTARVPSAVLRAPEARRADALHPGAWWVWALGLGAAASRTSNPLMLALLVVVAGYVVAARRSDAPWARSYGAFVKLGLLVIAIRLGFTVFLGSAIPGTHTVFTLPEVPLPDWAQGVRIGGRVTAEGLLFAFYDGLRLATLLICVGAANALANPARLLKSLPGALYEAGVAVVVAMTFAPQLIADVQRLRAARRLRGRPDRGVRGLVQVGLPVLEGALERSVALAAAMDARGYGRTAAVPARVRRTTAVLTLGGLLGVCAGSYGLLAAQGAGFGLPVLGAGVAAALAGLWLGGRRSVRTRYRPDRWGVRAWLVSGSGVAVAGLMIWAASADPGALTPGVVPLVAPELPLWPALGVLIGLLPAVAAPVPPRAGTASGRAPAAPATTAAPKTKELP
ncbi:Energy-coupling factor transporter transmembrane protein EcfT [Streptomyces sp. YIM 130001]|uniref:energy-coupling factor transporter transmembrane component T n=1 Tax=Streptomyces sp. YIM 130001 TaxID=2259644 RepID=UPI000E6563A5|nr:energy-coupling factor transporter transmembrane protein EcfT [Streptomyces sp. YIM 130001]RII16984.1 Energy-coupling factor transporter transmembrane protein EcfT [Streptomyces sp. YIM 130001]